MLRWLRRLLVWGLLIFAAIWIVSRVLNREEDFDDYDDIDLGMEFTETPVEIDVAAESAPARVSSASTDNANITASSTEGSQDKSEKSGGGRSVIDVNGIGPTYAARLKEAGIGTLDELSKADAGDLSEKLEVIGGRTEIEDWIKQAREMVAGGASGGE